MIHHVLNVGNDFIFYQKTNGGLMMVNSFRFSYKTTSKSLVLWSRDLVQHATKSFPSSKYFKLENSKKNSWQLSWAQKNTRTRIKLRT
jgi:hypothetical protein